MAKSLDQVPGLPRGCEAQLRPGSATRASIQPPVRVAPPYFGAASEAGMAAADFR